MYMEIDFFGTLKSVLCREVYYITSMPQRVYYQRFYCISYIEELALVMKKRKEKTSPVQ